MPYRDDVQALRDRAALLEAERDRALSELEKTRASLASLIADLDGLDASDDVPWRSVHGGEPMRVRFVNATDRKVELRWVSYDGRERLETTLVAGGEREINTNVAHLFRFVDAERGEILSQRYVRASEPRVVLEPTENTH